VILMAGPSAVLLARWENALCGLAPVQTVGDMVSLATSMARAAPQVLLLDLDLRGLSGPDAVRCLGNASPATRIVALSGLVSDETELAYFKAGARGFCRNDIEPQLLKRVVVAVQIGELWIRRSLTSRLLEELGAKSNDVGGSRRAIVGQLARLTQREREIAALIGRGDTNKQIARRLAITERTVKAHLSGIFRKLGIADRLKLALLAAGIDSI
jgi:DNA-binding NarL/FixJ family response regulator